MFRVLAVVFLVIAVIVLALPAFEPNEWTDWCVSDRTTMASAMMDDPSLVTDLTQDILADPRARPSFDYMEHVGSEYTERFEQLPSYLYHSEGPWKPGYGITVVVKNLREIPLYNHLNHCVEGVPVRVVQMPSPGVPDSI